MTIQNNLNNSYFKTEINQNSKKLHDEELLQKQIAINKKITQCRSVGNLIDTVEQNKNYFSHVNISTAIHKYAKIKSYRSQLNKQLTNTITDLALQQLEMFKPQHLANTAWAFAKLGIRDDALMEQIAGGACRQIRQFNPQNLANTAWAFATLGIQDDQLMQKVAVEACRQIRQFNAQNLANTAWAFATLGIRDDALMEQIGTEAFYQIRQFNAQALSNTAWAFATLGIRDDRLMQQIATEACRQIRRFNPQDLANTAWAFATLGIRDDRLMQQIATEACRKIRQFNAQDIANTAWAFATLGIQDDQLMQKVAFEASHQIRQFNVQNLANIAWAFATLGIRDVQLMQKVAFEASHQIRQFNAQGLANTAWAFATLGIRDSQLMQKVASEASHQIRQFNAQGLAIIAWAFATLGIRDDRIIKYIITEISKNSFKNIDHIHYSQLFQAFLFYKYILGAAKQVWPDDVAKRLSSHVFKEAESSRLHLAIANKLTEMGLKVTNEKSINGLIVDICIENSKLVIEVDGPSHYAYQSKLPLGHTIFKRNLLEAMGWTVINIPYWDWNRSVKIGQSTDYLRKLNLPFPTKQQISNETESGPSNSNQTRRGVKRKSQSSIESEIEDFN